MIAPELLADVAQRLLGASSVVVCAHVNPDGDAMGSVLALTRALRLAGVEATATLADDVSAPITYSFLPGSDSYVPVKSLEPPDVFVAVDTPNFPRLGDAEALAKAAGALIVLDHHPDNKEFGTLDVVDEEAAATAQIVWRLLPHLGVEPDLDIATCAYVGLVTDTGRFQYSNCTAEAHRDAADMIDVGVDVHGTYEALYENRSAAALALVGRVLGRITVANGGAVAYSWITDLDLDEVGAAPEETENLIDLVRTLGGMSVAVLLKEGHDGHTRGNLRAKTDADVGSVARLFGGGGHRAAAGFTFDGTMAELLPKLLAELPGA